MDGLKQIMYGVTDFARMRAGNGRFAGRMDVIHELEKPRRESEQDRSLRT